jgi:hypothetical protein
MALSIAPSGTGYPVFRTAVMIAAGTIAWCSGPCIGTDGCAITCSNISSGSVFFDRANTFFKTSIAALLWHESQT